MGCPAGGRFREAFIMGPAIYFQKFLLQNIQGGVNSWSNWSKLAKACVPNNLRTPVPSGHFGVPGAFSLPPTQLQTNKNVHKNIYKFFQM